NLLDITDHFANSFGIVGAGLTIVITLSWGLHRLREMSDHLNAVSSFEVGGTWTVLLTVVTPLVLGFMFISQLVTTIREGYGDMPAWYVEMFGWGMSVLLFIVAVILSNLSWKPGVVERDIFDSPQLEKEGVR